MIDEPSENFALVKYCDHFIDTHGPIDPTFGRRVSILGMGIMGCWNISSVQGRIKPLATTS